MQNQRSFSFPERYQEVIAQQLRTWGFDLGRPKSIAESILRLSDFYLAQDGATPWTETWAQVAYLSYFFPLNYVRCRAVIKEAVTLGFFTRLNSYIDFGAGLGTWSLAIGDSATNLSGTCVEIAAQPVELYRALGSHLKLAPKWITSTPAIGKNQLGVMSYTLNELERTPDWLIQCDALMIIEPSTRAAGRKLQELRSWLIKQGYHVWAPCTHQHDCPLLTHSQKDWCHDRVFWQMPSWFAEIEKCLPIKNRTLTFSYLLAKRTPPPEELLTMSRLTGDQQHEKGKTKQMVCRGPEREFLTWLHKNGKPSELWRGELVRLPTDAEKHGPEIRVVESDLLRSSPFS